MQNAKIFLVEDHPDMLQSLREMLDNNGHTVVLEASDLEEVLRITNSGELKNSGADIAIVDGNFPEKKGGEVLFKGPAAAKAIKGTNLPIKVIAHTMAEKEFATYGDVYVRKTNSKLLLETIASL